MPLMGSQMAILGHGIYMLSTGGFSLAWLAPVVGAGALILFFSWLMMQRAARTSANLPIVLVAALAGVALVGADFAQTGTLAVLPASYAAIVLALDLVYLFWYSRFDREPSVHFAVGNVMPTFEVEDEHGEKVSSDDFRGGPAVFLFFRGNWCPLCMAQIKEIASMYRDLEQRGAKVALISPQSHGHTKDLAKRFDAPFAFLVDPGGAAAKELDIYHVAGVPAGMEVLGYDSDTVFPTVVITDAAGVVLFAHQTDNYRVRPEPETFLAVLDGKDPAALEAEPAPA